MNRLTNRPNPQWHSPDAGDARPHLVDADLRRRRNPHSTVAYENVSNSLFPGALGGAEFHARGQAVRRLSAVADQFIELERHFGGALFRRKPGVALTALGRAVWPHLKQIVQSADDAREAASTFFEVTRAHPTGLAPLRERGRL